MADSVFTVPPTSRLKVALFKQKLENDVWKRHHDR